MIGYHFQCCETDRVLEMNWQSEYYSLCEKYFLSKKVEKSEKDGQRNRAKPTLVQNETEKV